MGTRFLATKECPISETYKDLILKAKDHSTMIAAQKGFPIRVLKNKAALSLRAMDEKGASQEEINAFVDALSRGAADDRENRLWTAGQVCGMIQSIVSVEELIQNMAAEAEAIAHSLGKTF